MREPTTYILLIRHGENDWVGSNRLAGRTPGVHLNERGRQQVQQLIELLSRQPVSAIYSSPLERCLETAQPVAEALGLPVITEEAVQEVDYGDWQGGELKALSQTPEWSLVQHHPSSFRFPGGESLREVQFRAVTAIERMRERHPNQLVAVFSHGDVIRTSLAHYMGTPLDLFQRIGIGTASISGLAFHGARPMVLFVNYHAELPRLEFKSEEATQEAEHAAANA
ncbi:MSMEG_4193 family putative phosphomutase [Litorilinea aerophila]|uniref:MSMEG_4193 family putative phosphomutase n=1 Tax=Litorilinea aerophila TaxID=1204385 RepID=A0A540VLI4_9CHLR|nr:MSMEG_4193 family putative phosphomutase [Litorilinea aerophila]MCC9075470.1 MSMEG_4193 family putative phosphomutase [Litorilinea aerophila]OUC09831.1 phosphoglycerate mutase [Litorilinea aerophila]GIV76353.1 MAG: phosphoglycerate mutase [Litorilinea sp.]